MYERWVLTLMSSILDLCIVATRMLSQHKATLFGNDLFSLGVGYLHITYNYNPCMDRRVIIFIKYVLHRLLVGAP